MARRAVPRMLLFWVVFALLTGLVLTLHRGGLAVLIAPPPVPQALALAQSGAQGVLQETPTATVPGEEETPTQTPDVIATAIAATLTALAPTLTPTPTLTAVPTPRPTLPPRPAHLPIAVRDPAYQVDVGYLDVVIALDGSHYMREVHGPRRETAWDLAIRMVRGMAAMLDMEADGSGRQDQLGIVVFRRPMRSQEELPLRSGRAAVVRFVDSLTWLVDGERPADQTNMDIGLRRARDLAKGPGHKPENRPVVVMISEMQAKGVRYEGIDDCTDTECAMLYWAENVKRSGVTVVLFATSYGNRGMELKAMASDPSLALLLPSAEEMRSALDSVRPRSEPPSSQFWPYR